MKLTGRDAQGYFRKPDPEAAGVLLFGGDQMRVADRRRQVLAALLGPEAEAEMRLERLSGADLRSDPARLEVGVKATGFFPGPRAVLVEDATDGLAPVFQAVLGAWNPGDAQMVVTAKQLNASSKLRKTFEAAKRAYAIGIYDDPPSRGEIEEALGAAGLTVAPEAMADLEALARALDPGDFRQTLEKLSLYKLGDEAPVSPADIAACAPAAIEAGIDDILHAVAEARQKEIGPILRRLSGQGVQPVALCIAAVRHFRTLHTAAAHPGGVQAGLKALRPPVFGPRRDRIARQAGRWRVSDLERALGILVDTDMQLRSGAKLPQMALVERALIRIAMTAQARA